MRLAPIPQELLSLASGQCGLVSARQCAQFGLSADRRAALVRFGVWGRIGRSVYDTTPTALAQWSWPQRHCRGAWAGLLTHGPDAVAVGSSALALLGVAGLPARVTSEVALPGGRSARSRDGMHLRQFDAGMVCVEVAGRLVAAPEWALAQVVPTVPRDHAVALMDSVQNLELLDRDGLERARGHARRRRWVLHTHDWWQLSDARAQSAIETFGRLRCVDAGIPPDALQVRVLDAAGAFVGDGDMGWEQRNGRWLIAEMDGREFHDAPEALLYDRHRQNRLVTQGRADVLRFTSRDLYPRPQIPQAIRAFLRSADSTRDAG